MFNFGKFTRKNDEQAVEIAHLKELLAQYKHAFETTAIDRDRLSKLIAEEVQPDTPSVIEKDSRNVDPNVAIFGVLWGGVANIYEAMQEGRALDQGVFEQTMFNGGFSQFTKYANPIFLDQMIDWQLDMLRKSGLELDALPECYCEAEVMPAYARRVRGQRDVSIDFLRLLAYNNVIQQQLERAGNASLRLIVEIGSGYGSLARLLKLSHPKATICLVDIPACLRVAEYYIKSAIPESNIRWCGEALEDITAHGIDFYLVPVEQAHHIRGQSIDLAINVWSFGEMPNTHIQNWFDLIQKYNETSHLFLLNHFMAPVVLQVNALLQHATHYDWLSRIDQAWRVHAFEIDPIFERPPGVMHKHCGVLIFADRLTSDADIDEERVQAANAAKVVHVYDWVVGSTPWEKPTDCTPAQARHAYMTRAPEMITDNTPLVLDQFARMLGLWRPDLDGTKDGAFFRLWNDYRLSGNLVSLRLLRIWFRMHWCRPMVAGDGKHLETIFREELHYGLDEDGNWIDDPFLLIPTWLDKQISHLRSAGKKD